mmetsp:Transcript_106784/g.308895  ORF Transcript_106784/g.308895 Transcript_106784/m.308895 type:complete len:230 (-) Transcript_106784:550-1239(-)
MIPIAVGGPSRIWRRPPRRRRESRPRASGRCSSSGRKIVPDVLINEFPLVLHLLSSTLYWGDLVVRILRRLRLRGYGRGLRRRRRLSALALRPQTRLGALPRIVLELVSVLLLPLIDLPLHPLLRVFDGIGVVGILVLRAHRSALALLSAGGVDHGLEGPHVRGMLGVVLLAHAPPLGALLLDTASVESLCGAPILDEHRPIVEVPQVGAVHSDALPVVRDPFRARVPL